MEDGELESVVVDGEEESVVVGTAFAASGDGDGIRDGDGVGDGGSAFGLSGVLGSPPGPFVWSSLL